MSTGFLDVNDELSNARIEFRSQPRPIPADARVVYKLAQIAVVLNAFNKNSATIENLHLFTWSLQSKRAGQMLMSWWSGNRHASTITQKSDPHLTVALNVGLIRGMVNITGANHNRVTLQPLGVHLAQQIELDEELMGAEKMYMRQFGRLSDAAVLRKLARNS
ncbi:hypothetical protein OUQ49_05755 [Streptomyces cavourensis]|uniref:hypothetical protein n=1 Tax=Streptomyces cavourensis TaxID=67258 RepID=UPI0022799507|nr:hypothetical protein [Streptomyces cavourensis]WAE65275.1 hypothetical protein OUQ49_05755 [Streptomyces cavourensis]